MSVRTRMILLLVGASVATGLVFTGFWAVGAWKQTRPPVPVSTVPASWREFRDAPGHQVHVAREGIACAKCHDVTGPFRAPSPRVCVPCHEQRAGMRHGLHAARIEQLVGIADCTSCHNFGPTHEDRVWACIRCHEEPQGQLAPVVFHATEACGKCHKPHDEPGVVPIACVSCHAEAANTHAHKASDDPANCLTCHAAHGSAKLAVQRCQTCHEDKPHALFPGGHEQCTSCHAAHGFGRSEVKPCRSCHESQHVLAESQVKAHRECTSCHDPHAVAKVDDAKCETCHASVMPSHPKTEALAASLAKSPTATTSLPKTGSHDCIGCHTPHSPRVDMPLANPCTQCHASVAGSDSAAHGGHAPCLACHKPHAFAHPEQPAVCTSCHKLQLTETALNKGHVRCLGCHQGQLHAAALPPVACASCHANVHPRQEHTQCLSCHEPHSGKPRPQSQTCATCHAREQASVVKVHKECLACHTSHEGGKLPAAQCVSCHQKKAAENHGKLAGGCISCHSIHGEQGLRSIPACTTCHKPAELPGLHAIDAHHQQCTQCHHDAHNPGPFSDRATCLACHADKKDHVPEAQLCQGCHVFRR